MSPRASSGCPIRPSSASSPAGRATSSPTARSSSASPPPRRRSTTSSGSTSRMSWAASSQADVASRFMSKVACIGECMIELKQAQGTEPGLFSRGYGGDTLNTAVYLTRLGVGVDYITALGDDSLSDEMISGWAAEGVGTSRVTRLPGKLPGIYMIQTDDRGERRFFHWRDSAAARSLMDLPDTADILDSLAGYDIFYLSAITLSLYNDAGRARLFAGIRRARES